VSSSAAVELREVSKTYSPATGFAIRGINLAIPRGALIAIIGGSGCGKTTTLKIVNRLIEPDSGEVLVDGAAVRSVPAYELRRRIGYVFQGIGLFPHMSVAENIGVTPRLLGWSNARIQQRVVELLQLVDLPVDYGDRSPAMLSGGQRQRIGVARALAAQPLIMLMDEPFGALDPMTRDALGTQYRKLHEQLNLTTVMVTHDVMEAALLADRIVVMRAGEIVAAGTPRQLMDNHCDETVRDLMDMPRRQSERIRSLLQGRDVDG
jgi:osmoprotectant transport system ATP-binding protein